jgi:hypothetical protein
MFYFWVLSFYLPSVILAQFGGFLFISFPLITALSFETLCGGDTHRSEQGKDFYPFIPNIESSLE